MSHLSVSEPLPLPFVALITCDKCGVDTQAAVLHSDPAAPRDTTHPGLLCAACTRAANASRDDNLNLFLTHLEMVPLWEVATLRRRIHIVDGPGHKHSSMAGGSLPYHVAYRGGRCPERAMESKTNTNPDSQKNLSLLAGASQPTRNTPKYHSRIVCASEGCNIDTRWGVLHRKRDATVTTQRAPTFSLHCAKCAARRVDWLHSGHYLSRVVCAGCGLDTEVAAQHNDRNARVTAYHPHVLCSKCLDAWLREQDEFGGIKREEEVVAIMEN
ncbi:Eukaryotic translation initiation factor 6 [Mycena chlorophos]|uniref:Eukaryotic translation initiation factor 6 n=1 Tax=Mycena chlorophos TaxID=658473 RepID=A0A8H6WGS2_MYCCL|nr:Eukaryotic translation initiation factor 6 [Mycena chlorophos]